jgi:MoaA/NifB/PqqE/SkfB family radical SAM enzyme
MIRQAAFGLYRGRVTRRLLKESILGRQAARAGYQIFMKRQYFPRVYNIELTNHCNMKCVMCKNHQIPPEGKHYLDTQVLARFVAEIDSFGPHTFLLVKQGDALAHPEFPRMLGILRAASRHHRIYLTTNGLALHGQRLEAILDHEVDFVTFSIDSIVPKTYRKIRGRPLQPVLENLRELMRRKVRSNLRLPHVSVNMVVMKSNAGELDMCRRFWGKEGIQLTLQKANYWVEDTSEAGNPRWTLRNQAAGARYPCYAPFLSPTLNSDGTVSICCGDWNNSCVLGDFRKQSFAEIWHGEAYARVRRCHLEGDYTELPLCAECGQWKSQPNIFFPWQYAGPGRN